MYDPVICCMTFSYAYIFSVHIGYKNYLFFILFTLYAIVIHCFCGMMCFITLNLVLWTLIGYCVHVEVDKNGAIILHSVFFELFVNAVLNSSQQYPIL
jgi:hypothetical protein